MPTPLAATLAPAPPLSPTLAPTLAQGLFGGLTIPAPQPLKGAPLWETYILEQPWPLAAILLVVAIVVVLKGRGTARRVIPVIALLAAIGVFAAGMLVTTAREHIEASTRNLINAVATGDTAALAAQLDPAATLYSFRHNEGVDKDAILGEVGQRFRAGGEYAVTECTILELASSQDGRHVGRSQVKVRIISAAAGVPVFSWWLLDYRHDDAGTWRVIRLEPQSISFVNDSRANR